MTPLALFAGYGIEIELMIVDQQSLAVRPFAEHILTDEHAAVRDEMPLGQVLASNELAAHVIELKTTRPAPHFSGLAAQFRDAVRIANQKLAPWGARLLGTGMHPFMDPRREAVLWPYGQNDVYQAYNRIFNCQGHGWVNLQSVHLNLPFADADDFGRLHAAVRCVLPLIPALCASTPVIEGRLSALADTRLAVYRDNQKKIPSISGVLIPERVFTPQAYGEKILAAMYQDIAPFDQEHILQEEWLNSRGAIARFDRNAIEIRLMDTQECVEADIALSALLAAVTRGFVEEDLASYAVQKSIAEQPLAELLERCIKKGEAARMDIDALGAIYPGMSGKNAGAIWQSWYERLAPHAPELCAVKPLLEQILSAGTLASRIRKALAQLGPLAEGMDIDRGNLRVVYGRLAEHAHDGTIFSHASL